MKKFTSLLIGVSLALAGAAFAQQPEEQASPKKEKPAAEKTQPAEPKTPKTRGANLASPEATASKQTGAMKEPGATNEPGAEKVERLKRPRNLRPPPAPKRTFPVNRPRVRRRAGGRAEMLGRPRNLRLQPVRKPTFPVKRPRVRRPPENISAARKRRRGLAQRHRPVCLRQLQVLPRQRRHRRV